MAQKTNGSFDFSFGLNVQLEGPLDARITVEEYSDLQSVPQKYDGMIVSVTDDANAENVGVYYYLDSSETWVKVGTGDADGGIIEWVVDASSASPQYVLIGPGTHASYQQNPNLYLMRGQTYRIRNETGSHPLEIREDDEGATYTQGITGNGVSNGVLEFEVPLDAPAFLVYQCTAHPAMIGYIQVLGTPPGGGGEGVAIQPTLGQLSNVDTTGVANGNVIKWSDANQVWEAATDNNTNQLVWRTITADTGSTTANTTADTLEIAGGTDIETSITGDTVTINFTGAAASGNIADGYSRVLADTNLGLQFYVGNTVLNQGVRKSDAPQLAWTITPPVHIDPLTGAYYQEDPDARGGHLIPDIHNAFDIGSTQKQVRHIYVSQNSIWMGDDNRITIDPNNGEFTFQKRDREAVPPALVAAGLDINEVRTRLGKGATRDLSLDDWKREAKRYNLDMVDVFDTAETSLWEKSKTLTSLERGDEVARVPQIDIVADKQSQDITSRFQNSSTGILLIKDSSYPISIDIGALAKTNTSEPYEIYHQRQIGISIGLQNGRAYSVFEDELQDSISCRPGQFIKMWYNASTSRFEYIYRSL